MNIMWLTFGLVGVALFVGGLIWDRTHTDKRSVERHEEERSPAYAGTRS